MRTVNCEHRVQPPGLWLIIESATSIFKSCVNLLGGGSETQRAELWRHTHGAEIARPAQLSLVAAVQQHLLQLVSQPVQELPHGRLGLPRRRQKVVEVQDPRQRGPGRLSPRAPSAVAAQRCERVPRSGRHLPVPPEKSQPPPRAEYVRLLHAPREQQVLVADGDGGENEPLGVHHVRLGVHGRGEQVPHSVGGPGEEQRQSRQESQQPRNSPRVGAADEDVPQAMQRGVLQEQLSGFGEGARSRFWSGWVALAHFGGRLTRALNIGARCGHSEWA